MFHKMVTIYTDTSNFDQWSRDLLVQKYGDKYEDRKRAIPDASHLLEITQQCLKISRANFLKQTKEIQSIITANDLGLKRLRKQNEENAEDFDKILNGLL